MATLVHPILPRRFTLGARTLIGRSPHCTFQIKNRLVSGEHALITWSEEGGWRIRDLGSRNGSFVDGQTIRPGERIRLYAGAELTFADERWHLSDDTMPVATARREGDPEPQLATDDLLFLPDDSDPQVMIFADRNAGEWIAEMDDEQRAVKDQSRLTVGGESWLLGLPPIERNSEMSSTLGMDELSLALSTLERLQFGYSRDEEHVELTIWYRHKPLRVPARSHHYMLLTLARAIDEDSQSPRAEKGWRYVDDLCRMLNIDSAKLNTLIFRARKQFASLGVGGAARLVERRPATRQLRLGVDRVEMRPL